jgi:hypothetical protein
MITGNEPAFPTDTTVVDGEVTQDIKKEWEGITIRQHFAAMAMQGILSNPKVMDEVDWHYDVDAVVKNSVFVADALIDQLNK